MSDDCKKKEFIKILEGLDRSKSRVENFSCFAEMAYCALAKKTAISDEEAEKLEARYMGIVDMYNDKDDVRKMPQMLSLTMQELNNFGGDFLGEISGEIGALDKKNGQFFTPYNVSKMMALMTLPDIEKIVKGDGFFSMSDPAAGAGCMLIAAADAIQEKGFNPMDVVSAHAVELNKLTYYMLFVQLSLRGIPALVLHGNSLSNEVFERAYTPISSYFIGKHGKLFKENDSGDKSESKTNQNINPTSKIDGTQFELF